MWEQQLKNTQCQGCRETRDHTRGPAGRDSGPGWWAHACSTDPCPSLPMWDRTAGGDRQPCDLGSRKAGTLPRTQDSCATETPHACSTSSWDRTPCILPSNQLNLDAGKRLEAHRGPTLDNPSQAGSVATFLTLGPASSFSPWGDTTCSQRCSEDPMRTQVTVLSQRWPSPGSTGVNFPAGKRNREWDPSGDWHQGSNVPGGQVPTAPPCCLHVCNIHAEY